MKGTENHPSASVSILENGDTTITTGDKQIESILDFERRHDRVYQALINCLETTKAIKIYTLTNVHEIWKRLQEEYGQISDIKRNTALSELHSLRKESATSMEEHIRTFTKLQTLVDYHKPPTSAPMTKDDVNMIFMMSLGHDWKLYHLGMSTRITVMTTAQLFAEMRSLEMVNQKDEDPDKTAGKVLNTHGKHPGARREKRKHKNEKPYDKNQNKNKNKKWHPGMKGYKKCDYCDKEGHLEADCFKKKR